MPRIYNKPPDVKFLKEDEIFLIENWNKGMSARDIAEKLGRTRSSIAGKIYRLRSRGVFLREKEMPEKPITGPWDQVEIDYLLAAHSVQSRAFIANFLGRTKDAVASKVKKLRRQGAI